jgi:hypothetical protein
MEIRRVVTGYDERAAPTVDTIVQRGIGHAWTNRGTTTCRLVKVSVAATLRDGHQPD